MIRNTILASDPYQALNLLWQINALGKRTHLDNAGKRSIAALVFLCIFQFHSVSLRRDLLSAVRSMPPQFSSLLLALLAWKGIRLGLEFGLWTDLVQSQLLAEQSSKVLASLQPWDG